MSDGIYQGAIANPANQDQAVQFTETGIKLFDKNGQVIKAGDKNPSVGAHSADRTKVSTRLRTIEAADAPKVRLRAEIVPK